MESVVQFAERCQLLAETVDWLVQSLPEDRDTGDDPSKVSSVRTLQFVGDAATELKDAVSRVQGLEAMLSKRQADIIKQDAAEASATAKLAEAERQFALASDKMREYEILKGRLEDDQSQVKTSMDDWASRLEALKQHELALKQHELAMAQERINISEASAILCSRESTVEMAEKKWESLKTEVDELDQKKLALQKEVGDIVDDLSTFRRKWRHLQQQDKLVSEKIQTYNERLSTMEEWQQSQEQSLKDEKARVGRRDETIRRLEAKVQARGAELRAHEEASTSLQVDYEATVKALGVEKEVVRGLESQVQVERKRADELQRQLSEANGKIKALERASDEASKQQDFLGEKFEDLARRIDGLKVSNTETVAGLVTSARDTVKCSVDGMENTKNAMVVATTEAIGQFRSQWSPKMRKFESSAQELGATNKDLQLLEQKWSARLRLEKASAEAKKADLIYAFRMQSNEEHKAELADLRLHHEVEREADRAALSEARSEAERLRGQLSGALEVHTSPERRRKRVRGNDHGDDVLRTPLSSAQASRAAATQSEPSMWQVALDTADEVWRSFEPVILTDDISYSYLIGHLSFAITTEENIGRFREFLNSDAKGWYCATAVIKLGYKDEKSKRAEGCVFSEKHNKGHYTGLRKVSTTRKLEIKFF